VVGTVLMLEAVLDGEDHVFEGVAEGADDVLGAWLVVWADGVEGALDEEDLLLAALELEELDLELITPESGGVKLYP